MASFKNKFGLSIDSSPKISRKYLGDPEDPHFIPVSPIISRQIFTPQEEGELKRLCALVLAHVPHSDDMSEDPLKYIATQIKERSDVVPASAPAVVPAKGLEISLRTIHKFGEVGNDTATPSEASMRDTMERTSYSTPLTSAGITPGETTKRFSDAAWRASSMTKGSSNLRNQTPAKTPAKTKSRATSGAGHRKSTDAVKHKSHEARKPSTDTDAAKRSLRLVHDTTRYSETDTRSEVGRPTQFLALDLNKELPPPPPEADNQKRPPIGRLMKSIKRKKSIKANGRTKSTSAVPTPPMPFPTAQPRRSHLAHQQKISPSPLKKQSQLPQLQPESKSKFRLRFFGRRNQQASVVAL